MPDVHGGQDGLPSFRFPMEAQEARSYEGGSAKEATAVEFPVSQRIAGVSMRLVPGGLRELHWHATAAEWAYVITGQCRITFFDPAGNHEIDDFGPGDIWFFPRGYPHSIQAIGDKECHFILVFDDGHFSEFATFSVTDWVGHTRPRCWPRIWTYRPRRSPPSPRMRSTSPRARSRHRFPSSRRRDPSATRRSRTSTGLRHRSHASSTEGTCG